MSWLRDLSDGAATFLLVLGFCAGLLACFLWVGFFGSPNVYRAGYAAAVDSVRAASVVIPTDSLLFINGMGYVSVRIRLAPEAAK